MDKLLFIFATFCCSTGFSQDWSFDDYYNQYPEVEIPSRYTLKTDRSGRIIGSPDSVLRMAGIKVVESEKNITRENEAILLSEFMKCKNLLTLSFKQNIETLSIDFRQFSKLRGLTLNFNWAPEQLNTIAITAKGLKHLNITFDKPLPESLFQLNELSYLNISQVGKNKLSVDIAKLTSLKHVVLNHYIPGYDESVWTIPNMQVLEIQEGTVVLPENFQRPEELKFLKLDHLDTLVFPESMKCFDSLNALAILDITTPIVLNRSISDLKSLKGLKINGCFLKSTPDLSGMANLEELTIINCRIDSYNLDFSKTENLKYLVVSNVNPVNETIKTKFPKGMKNLTNLETVFIRHVVVNKVPRYFSKFDHLNYLNLSLCKIDYKSIQLLNGMKNLKFCSYQYADNITTNQRDELDKLHRFQPAMSFDYGNINWEPKIDNYSIYLPN